MPKKIRPIRVEGNLAYVPLTQGYEAVIDAGDMPLIDGALWFAIKLKHLCYAATNFTSPATGKRRLLYLHRVLMTMPLGQVDHIDGDGLNNRRTNLRIASPSENQMNAKKRTDNTTGAKGVSMLAKKKFYAQLQSRGKRYRSGPFETVEDASKAYSILSAEHHGPFRRT